MKRTGGPVQPAGAYTRHTTLHAYSYRVFLSYTMPTITYAVSIWHEDETYTVKFQKARGTLKVVSHTFKAPMTVEEKDGAVLCTLTDDLSLHVSNEDATHFSLRATKDGKAGYATVTTKRLEEAKEYETSTYGFGRYFTA